MAGEALTRDDVLNAALAAYPNQTALAKAIGQAAATVSRWLSHKSTPEEGSVMRLARVAKLDVLDALEAFGYRPDDLGLDRRPRRRPPPNSPDLRLLRVSQMLEQFALEVRAMASASQLPNGSVMHAIASDNRVEYVDQTASTKAPYLTIVRSNRAETPRMGDTVPEAVA